MDIASPLLAPVVAALVGLAVWFVQSRVDAVRQAESRLRDERRKIYADLIGPFINGLSIPDAQRTRKPYDPIALKKAAFEVSLVSMIAAVLVLVGGCNPLRGPVIDERDDGVIRGTLSVSRGKYREGETVKVVFTIKNVSDQRVLLRREDAFVQDIMLFSYELEGKWSTESGRDLRELALAPGESSTIEWVIEDLEPGVYSLLGTWWSAADGRDMDTSVGFDYGPARY